MKIIYEDNHLIIVNKTCSELVQGDKTGDESLIDQVKAYIKVKYNKPGEVFLGLVHRLDRPTSGLVIFARTSKALTRMNELFKEKKVIKKYWAVVDKAPPKNSDTLTHFLIKNEKQNKSYVSESQKSESKEAQLTYKLLKSSDKYFLLEIELHTGRHHQIRAQLGAIGCKIKGDLKYGFPRSNKDGGIHLHARYLEFEHPVKKEPFKITAEVPDDPLWKFFEAEIGT
ncbi:MAG: RNA pseudouridine synthase [Cyclobacteriaceae bacterium]|nr:RNA pseudouridine synthase [Cyclobacteriaceae bacterium]